MTLKTKNGFDMSNMFIDSVTGKPIDDNTVPMHDDNGKLMNPERFSTTPTLAQQLFTNAGKYYNAPSMSSKPSHKYYSGDPSESTGNRSALNRMFDMLQVGMYASQGAIHGAITGEGIGKDMWEGIKAGNPFGAGNDKGEYTFSNNLEALGWKPESLGGKVAKGAIGLAGDILLDPLTYINPLSVGSTAVLKGTGQKVGKEIVEKFTPEMAEKALKATGKSTPTIEEIADTVRRVNKARGIVEEGTGKGFGIYGSNLPFANKLGIADKKIEFVGEAKLRAFGDATFAPYLNKLGESIKGSKVGRAFTTKGDLLDLARRDPEALVKGFEFARHASIAKLDFKDAMEKLKPEFDKLKELDPESQKQIISILEDKKLWQHVTTYKPLMNIKEGQDFHDAIQKAVDDFGRGNPEMDKILKELTPKFQPTQKVIARFPGVGDTPVEIGHIVGSAHGERYYKLAGWEGSVPESALHSEADIAKEVKDIATKKKLKMVKDSIDNGERGNINMSNEVNNSLDELIATDKISTINNPKGILNDPKNKPIEDFNLNDFNVSSRNTSDVVKSSVYRDRITTNTITAINDSKTKIFQYEDQLNHLSKLKPAEAKSRIDNINVLLKQERSKLEKLNRDIEHLPERSRTYSTKSDNLALKESAVDLVSKNSDNAEHLVDSNGEKFVMRDQYRRQPEFFDKTTGKKVKPGSRRLTEDISIEKDGTILNHTTGEILAKNSKAKSSNNSLDEMFPVHGYSKKIWEETKGKTDNEVRAFFDTLVEKNPILADAFSDIKKAGKYNSDMNIKAIKNAVDTYFDGTSYDLIGSLHRFNKDYPMVNEILEKKFGSYKDLSSKQKAKRMEEMYRLFNNPRELKQLSEAHNLARYNIDGASKDIATDMEKSIKTAEQRADEYSTKIYQQGDTRHGYVLQGDRSLDKEAEGIMLNLKDETGAWQGKVQATQWNGDTVTHVNYKGKEISVEDLNNHGFGLEQAKETNITGSKFKHDRTPENDIERMLNKNQVDVRGQVDKGKLQGIINKRVYGKETQEQISKGLAYIFDDEIAISKIEDEPLDIAYDMPSDKKVRSQSKKQIEDSITGRVDTEALKADAMNEAMVTKVDETNKAVIKEAQDEMIAEIKPKVKDKYTSETPLPKHKTIEEALSEIPDDVQRILDKQHADIMDYKALQYKINIQREALSNQTQFEAYAKSIWGDEKWSKLMDEHSSTVRAIDKTDWDNQDIINIAKDIRKTFDGIAVEEIQSDLLQKYTEGYATHMFNPEFISPLSKYTPEELANMGIKIPTNAFDNTRAYKVGTEMPNGYVLQHGTVEEINGVFENIGKQINEALVNAGKDPLKSQAFFIDQISDVYLNRMQKHYQLMYDHNVYGDLANKFGTLYGTKAGDIRNIKEVKDGVEAWTKMRIDSKSGEATILKEGDKILKDGHTLTVSTKQIKEYFKGMDEKLMNKQMEMLGLDKNTLDKLGNTFHRISPQEADVYNKLGIADVHQIPNNVLDKAETLGKTQFASDTHGLLKIYDKFLLAYKKMVTAYTPSFHINNIKGNTFNNYLDVGVKAMSPRMQISAIDIIKGKTGDINLGGKAFSMDEIRRELKIQGIDDTGFFGTIKNSIFNTPEKSKGFKAIDEGIMNASSNVEYHAKVVNFISNLDSGKSFTEAGEHVNKFLFDYSDITKFEHDVMQRIIPFYTWISKNAPLQLEQMLTNPKRYMPIAKAISEIEELTNKNGRIDKNKVPAFAKDWVQLPFNIMNENGNEETLMWSNNLPYMDINKIPNIFDMKDSAVNLFESSTPALKMPVELGTNYNYFFDKPIDKGEKVVDPSGKFKVSPQMAYLLGQVPQYAIPGGAIRKTGIDRLIHIFDKGMASGIKSYDNAGHGGGIMLK